MIYSSFGQQNKITFTNLMFQIKGHGEISISLKMSSGTNLTLEERFEALMKQNEILMKTLSEEAKHDQETKAQNKYLQKQLGAYLKQMQQANDEPLQFDSKRQEHVFSYHLDSSSDDEPLRMAGLKPRIQASISDFKVEIPEFEGKLDLKSSWIGYTRSKEFLSTKTSLKMRR